MEVFNQQGSMQPFDKAVDLWPVYLGGPVLNPLQLQEQLVGMIVRAPAELAPIVRQDGIDTSNSGSIVSLSTCTEFIGSLLV